MAPTKFRNRSASKASSTKKNSKRRSVEQVICESDEDDGSAIRPIVVLQKMNDLKRFEASEECFILDFDPDEVTLNSSNCKIFDDKEEDVVVVYEKGQVACRDYPHPRHLCLKFLFQNSMHESYCKLCYSYVRDTAAPCKYWMYSWPGTRHCHASDREEEWKLKRKVFRNLQR